MPAVTVESMEPDTLSVWKVAAWASPAYAMETAIAVCVSLLIMQFLAGLMYVNTS